MPTRNFLIIFVSVVVSLICYSSAHRNRYAALFSEAISIVEEQHLEQHPRRDLFVAAMNGMMESLDEHSMFLAGSDYKRFTEDMEQEFFGIGIQVTFDDKAQYVRVEMPILDSPAYYAGLQSGDLITSVDGTDTLGMKTDEVVKRMKGERGKAVDLIIRRPSTQKDFAVSIVRDKIKVSSVRGDTCNADGSWSFVLEEDPRIGYLRLSQFGDHSYEEVESALKSVNGQVDAIILDLRFNSGGLLDTAVKICDLFIDSGTIVSLRGRDKQVKELITASGDTLVSPDIPLVILINEYSASASEIVAACLQDHHRAVIVGQRSYGKGTVQNVIELEPGRSKLKLTTASYWRPSEKNIHKSSKATDADEWGVKPDEGFEVKMDEDLTLKVFQYRRVRDLKDLPGTNHQTESIEPVDDPQMRKAIEYLQQKIAGRQAA